MICVAFNDFYQKILNDYVFTFFHPKQYHEYYDNDDKEGVYSHILDSQFRIIKKIDVTGTFLKNVTKDSIDVNSSNILIHIEDVKKKLYHVTFPTCDYIDVDYYEGEIHVPTSGSYLIVLRAYIKFDDKKDYYKFKLKYPEKISIFNNNIVRDYDDIKDRCL